MSTKDVFDDENMGYVVKLWRLARKFSLEDFSRQTGISMLTLESIENDQKPVSIDELYRMAAVLEIEPGELVADIGAPSQTSRIKLLGLSVAAHPDSDLRDYIDDLISAALEQDELEGSEPDQPEGQYEPGQEDPERRKNGPDQD